MSGPTVHKLLEQHINRFLSGDDTIEDLKRNAKERIEEQAGIAPSTYQFSNLLTKFMVSGLDLLAFVDNRDPTKHKLAGIAILDSLLETNDEIKPERRIELCNHVCKLLEFDKLPLAVYEVVLQNVTSLIGHFVRIANTSEMDFFGTHSYQLGSSKLLGNFKSESQRFAGALLINQLVGNAPTLIFSKRKNLLELIWNLICDKSPVVRAVIEEILEGTLKLISQRESIAEYAKQALSHMNSGLNSNSSEKIIGSLTILDIITGGVITISELHTFIIEIGEHAPDIIWKVLKKKESKEDAVRLKLLEILPNLVAAFPSSFVQNNSYTQPENFLMYSIKMLIQMISSKKLRSCAYVALGKLYLVMSASLRAANITEDIFHAISDGFREPFCPQALQCLGMIVNVSEQVRQHVDDYVIDCIFRGGLSADLVDNLKILMKHVPLVRSNIREQLRTKIASSLSKYKVLIDEPRVKHPDQRLKEIVRGTRGSITSGISAGLRDSAISRPVSLMWSTTNAALFRSGHKEQAAAAANNSAAASSTAVGSSASGNMSSEEEIIFAMGILTMTEFFPKQFRERGSVLNASDREDAVEVQSDLLSTVKQQIMCYLDDFDPSIRTAAARACVAVLETNVAQHEPHSAQFQYLLQILDRLLFMAVGDDSVDIRFEILELMTPSLDHLISLSSSVHCLIEALGDEDLEVRSEALTLLARVAHYDSLHVMPVVRLTMKRLILTMMNTVDHVMKKETVQLLQALIRGSEMLIIPYVPQILGPLMNLLKDPSVDVVVAALASIGDLAVASPQSVRQHLNDISPHLIEALNDESSIAKQETAVIAMGKLVSSLTIVVTEEPYKRYEGLFEGLVRAIQSTDTSSSELRLQAIKTVGLLGFVDINAYQRHLNSYKKEQAVILDVEDLEKEARKQDIELNDGASAGPNDRDEREDSGFEGKKLSRIEKTYFYVVVKELMTILKDSALTQYHHSAANIAIKVLRLIGSSAGRVVCAITTLIDGVLFRLYQSDISAHSKDIMMDHIVTIIHIVGKGIRVRLDAIVKLVNDFAETQLASCLDIVEALSAATSNPHFYVVLRGTLNVLLQLIKDELGMNPLARAIAYSATGEDSDTVQSSSQQGRGGARANSLSGSLNGQPPGKAAVAGNGTERNRTGSTSSGNSGGGGKTSKILSTFNNLTDLLGEFRRDLVAFVVKILDCPDAGIDTLREALSTLIHLANDADLQEYASSIVHPLLRIITTADVTLQSTIVTAFSVLLCRLGSGYVSYLVPVRRKLRFLSLRENSSRVNRIEEYEYLVSRLLKQRPLPPCPNDRSDIAVAQSNRLLKRTIATKALPAVAFRLQESALETAWALAGRNNASDLEMWMLRMSLEMIRQSPSPIIRECVELAKSYRPLAHALFYISFHCIWMELFAGDEDDVIEDIPLINSIEMALQSPHIPKNILIPLLNLAEYMAMQDKPLAIDIRLLAQQSRNSNMFAKCMHYRETEITSKNVTPSFECIDALIAVNNQLNLPDRALGMLRSLVDQFPKMEIHPTWLEKLNRWEDAHSVYFGAVKTLLEKCDDHNNLMKHPEWITYELGQLRCLHALGEYEALEDNARRLQEKLKTAEVSIEVDEIDLAASRAEVQRLGANASWMLGKWTVMEEFLEGEYATDDETTEVVLEKHVSFFRAIMAIHNKEYERAIELIDDLRDDLATSIGSLLFENYSRAYRAMVTMQVLAEMEEVVEYKQTVERAMMDMDALASGMNAGASEFIPTISIDSSPSRVIAEASDSIGVMPMIDIAAKKKNLIQKWRGRLKWAPTEVEVYRQILEVHTLVTEPAEDMDSWIELVSLCRKEKMHSLCENILRKLGAPLPSREAGNLSPAMSAASASVIGTNDSDDATSPVSATAAAATHSAVCNTSIDFSANTSERVLLSTFEYWWSKGERTRALTELSNFLKSGSPSSAVRSPRNSQEATTFRVECLLKRADWMRELNGDVRETMQTLIEARELSGDRYDVWHAWAVANYEHLRKEDNKEANKDAAAADAAATKKPIIPATIQELNPFSLHRIGKEAKKGMPPPGRTNSNPRSQRRLSSSSGSASLLSLLSSQQVDSVTPFIVEAIKGFVRSIMLGAAEHETDVLQDTLRLITLWFSYGTKRGVAQILDTELEKISPDNWLLVIPQLIARIHIKSPEISSLLRKLLAKVSKAHPQALVCPISVAMNTNDPQQQMVAAEVLHEMQKQGSQLVEEATMVSRELMRVAITPHEMWYDGLEHAAQLYMESKDIPAMIAVLQELHDAMSESPPSVVAMQSATTSVPFPIDNNKQRSPVTPLQSPQQGFDDRVGKIGHNTLRDISFRHQYSKPLNEAQSWLEQFRITNCTADLHQAWEIYQVVFKKIKAQILSLKRLELHHVSPALTNAVDLILVVPGTYRSSSEVISIKSFSPFFGVISSKQRPRRMSLLGTNGKRYEFLLKGHEDLRQDERVMQLFGLINACLSSDNITNNRSLNIVRYSVLPLSNNSGLIGWVQNCDTMNQLVKQYRETKDIRLLLEVKLLHSKTPHYDKLTVLQKVELFEQVFEETSGQDVAKMLWLKSESADVWLERRGNFTKSMATMSMAGYILGLGDRHPSNLMIGRKSGRVVHIDFGDCFEITKQRAKYPEIIPFRLTRMLINAMGPASLEGSYRMNSERVMRVLRDNRDSVMAMLEAFVYDPLISWRLLANNHEDSADARTVPSQSTDYADSSMSSSVNMMRDSALPVASSLLDNSEFGSQLTDDINGIPAASIKANGGNNAQFAEQANLARTFRQSSYMRPMGATGSVLDKAPLRRNIAGDAAAPDQPIQQETLNTRALEVINRIQAKLTGRDFAKSDDDLTDDLTVEEQVERLIEEATSLENLCQLFTGWCPLW